MNNMKEGQIMIVRSSDGARFSKYSSYAFLHNGDIIAAVEDMNLIELEDYQGSFDVVKGGNLHPKQYDKNKYLFFSDQLEEVKEQYRNRHKK